MNKRRRGRLKARKGDAIKITPMPEEHKRLFDQLAAVAQIVNSQRLKQHIEGQRDA